MEANEIRIGCNFQLENGVLGGGIATIKNKYDLDVAFDLLESNSIKPIPLTEEWLRKFGFENIDKDDNAFITYTDSDHNYYLQIDVRSKDGKYIILDNSFDDLRAFSMMDVMYVHQLQNLYFALTGEELKLKP